MNPNEFKNFLNKIWKRTLLISILIGLVFSILSFSFPRSFISEGTFILIPNFEERKPENNNVYNYDGYYLDQISQSCSKTVTGLIETPEFKKRVSDNLKKDITFKEMFLLNLSSNFKEIAPRVMVLSVKSEDFKSSQEIFLIYEKEILFYTEKYNSQKVFKLQRLDNIINTYENSVPFYIYFFVSFFLTFSVIILFNYLKEYKNE